MHAQRRPRAMHFVRPWTFEFVHVLQFTFAAWIQEGFVLGLLAARCLVEELIAFSAA